MSSVFMTVEIITRAKNILKSRRIISCGRKRHYISQLYTGTEVPSLDGDTVEGDKSLIEEQFFVISDDPIHDHYFTHQVQKAIVNYLNDINYNLQTIAALSINQDIV